MKKSANFYLILTLIVNIALVGCRILSGNEGSDEDGNKDNEKPTSYENYSFEYLLNDGSGYQTVYTYARNGLKSLQMLPDGTGIHIELATGVVTYFSIEKGEATKITDLTKINSNLLTGMGVFGVGRIGERIGGETLDDNFCDIVKLMSSSGDFSKTWYCNRFDIALKFETYADDKLQTGFYLKNFQLGNCSDGMVKLPEGLDIIDLDAVVEY
jgi:hypothetical protein